MITTLFQLPQHVICLTLPIYDYSYPNFKENFCLPCVTMEILAYTNWIDKYDILDSCAPTSHQGWARRDRHTNSHISHVFTKTRPISGLHMVSLYEYRQLTPEYKHTSHPGLPTLQFLISCSMQNEGEGPRTFITWSLDRGGRRGESLIKGHYSHTLYSEARVVYFCFANIFNSSAWGSNYKIKPLARSFDGEPLPPLST